MKTYDKIGLTYKSWRRPDPRIAERISGKFSEINTVLNIGAGTGSYEPAKNSVISLDPSAVMLRSRPPGSAPCVMGNAEALPFRTAAFDGVMAIMTIHHWPDWKTGLREALRVCRRRIVIVTWDPGHGGFWLTKDYLKEIGASDSAKFPSMEELRDVLGDFSIEPILIPWDCTDGFLGAYWRRPEAYLDESKRKSISSLALSSNAEGLVRLGRDLSNGVWENKYGRLRNKTELDIGYRLVLADKAA